MAGGQMWQCGEFTTRSHEKGLRRETAVVSSGEEDAGERRVSGGKAPLIVNSGHAPR